MKILSIPIFLASSFAFAQEKSPKEPIADLEALTIESTPLGTKTSDVTQAWSVLSGNDLDKAKGDTIAETLSATPGVSQTHFGPTANRPIIRGMDKFRVRVLQNGTDSFDVSAQSEDHAVPIDPLMVDRIEVLRGSSALLHGGSAIGGVVNVIDRSIPTSPYDSPGASLRSSYTSANEGLSYGAIAFGSSDKLNYQLNVSKRDYNDYEAPSFKTEDHHTGEEKGPFTKVENSHSDSTTLGFGASYMLDSGFVGFSLSSYENNYGVPGEHADLDMRIEMESDRFQFRSQIEFSDSDWLSGIDFNIGYGDYKHSEIGKEDPSDEELHTHATYLREGFEGRIGIEHVIGNLRGVFGIHGLFDEFKIVGDESIFGGTISSEESTKIAMFLVEEFSLTDELTLNTGVRWESHDRDYEGSISDREDSTISANGGFSRDFGKLWNISGNINYSERVPDSAELYANGPHHATESYEVGNPNLDTESAVGLEVILRKTIGNVKGQFSAFHTRFDNYVFLEEREPELEIDDLPVKDYKAIDAEFQGIEVEIDWLAMENPGWDLLLSFYGDTIQGKNKTEGGNLSRVPASRLGFGFEVMQEKLDFGVNLTRSLKQDKLGHHEESTPAYSVVDAFASYDVSLGDSVGQLFVKGTNLTDELAYNHASVLKQFAPLPGRSVEIGLKFDF
ncbi:MAG: TonB-dependent receptor [Opitutales bacterium]|nr:TonB-dependent receptor [Opitutales bacterium]